MSNETQKEMMADQRGEIKSGELNRVKVRIPKKAWFDILFVDDDGRPMPNVEFEMLLSNGEKKEGKADGDGYFRQDDVREGQVKIKLKDGSIIEPAGNTDQYSKDDADPDKDEVAKVEYIIRKGDTLSKIARRFGTTWRVLYRTKGPDGKKNSERLVSGSPHLIYPGETVYVPTRRRVVRIHTNNAAKTTTRVRVRKKGRTPAQKREAQYQEVYYRKLEHKAVDNLGMAVGWDGGQKTLNVDDLCDELKAIIKAAINPKIKDNFILHVIQKDIMKAYDSSGKYLDQYGLSQSPMGLSGAYLTFEINGRAMIAALYDQSLGLGAVGEEGVTSIDSLILGEENKKRYLDSIVEIDEKKKLINFKKMPVYYLAPASEGEWAAIAWRAGNGLLDNYLGDSSYDSIAHERNLNVIEAHNAVYRGQLKKYVDQLKAIPASAGEDAIRKLGPPPEPYRYPIPESANSDQRFKLATKMGEASSYEAWLVISEKIFEMQNYRWPSMAARHQEGSIFFRAKFTLEPSVAEKINQLADRYLFGHMSSYKTIKLEWNFDAGSDGLKRGESRSVVFKEDGQIKMKKFEIGMGREVEIDDSGGKKVTVKGNFMGYGFETATDGEMKMTGQYGSTASWNQKTAEGGLGVNLSVPGIGAVYIGINFVLIKADTLLVYLTGAPGFFERKSCDTLVKTYWKNLTYQETKKLELLGWTSSLWDTKDQRPYGGLPDTARNPFDNMSYDQQVAAMHLGFQDEYKSNWVNFWKKLPAVSE